MSLNDKEAINSFLINKDRYKLIAHRLGFLMEGYPENSIENVVSILENKDTLDSIDGIEFDIHFTKDNVPMVVHDFNLADISDECIKVKKTNYEDLKDIKCGYRKSEYNSDTN
jgi:glycerophosphoryl diester phosphodiesterase